MAKPSGRKPKRSRCDCSTRRLLTGDEAAAYVETHLQQMSVDGPARLSSPVARSNDYVCERTGPVFVFYRASAFEPESLYRYPYVEDHELGDVAFWRTAAEQFRVSEESPVRYQSFEALHRMYSRSWREYLHWLKAGEADPEFAIVFLEADPWCRWSGYEKARVMRYVSRATHTSEQRRRLQDVVLAVTARGPRREFAETKLLAKRIWDEGLEACLRHLAASNPSTHRAVGQLIAKRYSR